MANYDSIQIITVGGERHDFPSDQFTIDHTKKFGEAVLLVTQIAQRPAYGGDKVRPLQKNKQRLEYFFINNIVSVSYRHYIK